MNEDLRKDTVQVPPLPPRRTVHSLYRNGAPKSELDRVIPAPSRQQIMDGNIFDTRFNGSNAMNSRPTTVNNCFRSSLQTQRFFAANVNRYSLNTPPNQSTQMFQQQPNWNLSTPVATSGNIYTPMTNVMSSYRQSTYFSQSSSLSNMSNCRNEDQICARQSAMSHHNSVHNFTYWTPASTNSVQIVPLNNTVNGDVAKASASFCKKKSNDNLIDLGDDSPKKNMSAEELLGDVLTLFDPLNDFKVFEEDEKDNKNATKQEAEPLSRAVTLNGKSDANKKTSDSCNGRITSNIDKKVVSEVTSGPIFRVVYRSERSNKEMLSFTDKLRALRSRFKFNDSSTNVGVVVSQMLESQRDNSLSVKLAIETSFVTTPVIFTCNVNTSVEHVICHTVCSIIDDVSSVHFDNFVLKVHGLQEYLSPDSSLADYAYIHQCHKFDNDVKLTLINKEEQLQLKFARTLADDEKAANITADDLLPQTIVCRFGEVNCDSVNILLDTLNKEISKLLSHSSHERCQIHVKKVFQATKALCSLLGNCETHELSEAVENLSQLFLVYDQYKQELPALRTSTTPPEVTINEIESVHPEVINHAITKFRKALKNMIELYCSAFPIDFQIDEQTVDDNDSREAVDILSLNDPLLCYIGTVNALSFEWERKYKDFYISCELRHGDRKLAEVKTKSTFITQGFFQRLFFDELLNFGHISISKLPRESYLSFTLYGIESEQVESSNSSNATPGDREVHVEIAFTVLKLFDYDEFLIQGRALLGLWTGDIVTKYDKSAITISCFERNCPLLILDIPSCGERAKFPSADNLMKATVSKRELRLLDHATQSDIYLALNRTPIGEMVADDKKLLWDRRNYLFEVSSALPKVLKSCPNWDVTSLPDIYSMVNNWTQLSAVDAMQLLLPSFPDLYVRKVVVQWISSLKPDELIDYLPQLVQVLRYDFCQDSPLLWFLLEKAYCNVRLAHKLYWLLKENVDDPVFAYRSRIVLNSLLCTCGNAMRQTFENQECLLEKLSFVSENLKSTKDAQRLHSLHTSLETVHDLLLVKPTPLPISPSMEVTGLEFKSCSYFTSNTLPLKLVFKNSDAKSGFSLIEAIYKVGDDLRQDMLTMQMIQIMDKLWLRDGLDLKMVTFSCVATDYRKGFVEMVKKSETLRKIQTEYGLTGSFNDRCIANWLQKYNASELEYQQAVDNFIFSCAGYAVATYILGVCDRHNDNIMITTSGHLFHIDFGKFLGDSQMLGNIKRDRVPFVLTSDMAYVINGGDKPSKQFQYFIDYCCQAFNIIRRHTNLFLSLFSLMISSGIPGVTSEAVKYVHRALHPSLSEAEAMSEFTRMITESLKSKFTQFNFFIHNLAQLRFTGDHNDQLLLSFSPKVYTRETDEKILHLEVVDFCKKYEPEKQYFFVIRVEREHQLDPSFVLRTYREFCEFYQKLCSYFPLAKFHPLTKGSSLIGRSNTREAAEKRRSEIRLFLTRLLLMADEVSHSDLLYTFFHPLLRDQEVQRDNEASSSMASSRRDHIAMRRGSISGTPLGQIKLSILYKNASLIVMVMHAKNLQSPRSNTPDCYAKTYLLPDPHKHTKRKTKIAWKNSHPTFMEMITYEMPLEVVQQRTLHVSIWDYDRVQENLFLGAAVITLREMQLLNEIVSWYPLEF